MVALRPSPVPRGEYVPEADGRVILRGVPWSTYEVLLALRGDGSVPRLSFLEGSLELMSPSRSHECIKSTIGSLIEAYAVDTGIELGAYGSWTLKESRDERGAEPDECYIVGGDQSPDRPNLAIEVIWTSGGIDKLEIYRRLDVGEVWVWRDRRLSVHVLRGTAYQAVDRSELFPALDLSLLASFAEVVPLTRAVREFRAAIPSRSKAPRTAAPRPKKAATARKPAAKKPR